MSAITEVGRKALRELVQCHKELLLAAQEVKRLQRTEDVPAEAVQIGVLLPVDFGQQSERWVVKLYSIGFSPDVFGPIL